VAALLAHAKFCIRLEFHDGHAGEPRGKLILGFARENQPTLQGLLESMSRQAVENRPVAGICSARDLISDTRMPPGCAPFGADVGTPLAFTTALTFALELHQQNALSGRVAAKQVIPYALAKGIKALRGT